jgi:hypothetical protein
MRNYLSFGGGVNSVAMMLVLLDEGVEFEAVYVWMPDWPETHEYLMMLEEKGYPITVLTPAETVKGIKVGNLYEYSWLQRMFPQRNPRWCTAIFKVGTLLKYQKPPAFVMLGIDNSETHRAKLSRNDGLENRFPLIERGIDRDGCIEIIKAHNLPIPIKSGCYICPFQRVSQFKQLRRNHPELFCKVVDLERRNNASRAAKGLAPYYTMKKPIDKIVNEPDTYLFDDMAYPPCHCGL